MSNDANKNQDIMTSAEVCAALGISQPTLSRRVKDGDIIPLPKPVGLKRHYRLRFQRSEIERLLS